MNSHSVSFVFSTSALLISLVAYMKPKKPGGPVQWHAEINEENNSIRISHVGTAVARNLTINILYNSTVSNYKSVDKSFPGESFTIIYYRSMGTPNPVLEITWRQFRFLRRFRRIEI